MSRMSRHDVPAPLSASSPLAPITFYAYFLSSRSAALVRALGPALRDHAVVVRLFQRDHRDMGEAHVVNRAAAPAHPIARIRIQLVSGRVIMPPHHVQYRPRREQRRDVV